MLHLAISQEMVMKVVIVGDSQVGKTALVKKYRGDPFPLHHDATIGSTTFTNCKVDKTHDQNGMKLKQTYCDTAGHQRYRALLPMYLRKADIVIVVYDVTIRASFTAIDGFIREIKKCEENAPIVLVANKIDLVDKRVVSEAEGIEKAKDLSIPIYEVSARSGVNVETLFSQLDKICLEKLQREEKHVFYDNVDQVRRRSSVRLENETQFNSRAYCEALDELERTLHKNSESCKPLIEMGFSVHASAKSASNKGQIPNSEYPGITQLLRDVAQSVKDFKIILESEPEDRVNKLGDFQKKLDDLAYDARQVYGKQSWWQFLAGAVLAFVGMAAASVFLIAAIGLITLSVPFSVFAIGAGLVAVGGMFAHNGRRKDVSLAGGKFEKTARRHATGLVVG